MAGVDPHVGMAAMLASGQRKGRKMPERKIVKLDERELLDFEARCLKAEARAAELEETLRALFRLAAEQHRTIHGPHVTSREWSDMRARVQRTLLRDLEVRDG